MINLLCLNVMDGLGRILQTISCGCLSNNDNMALKSYANYACTRPDLTAITY